MDGCVRATRPCRLCTGNAVRHNAHPMAEYLPITEYDGVSALSSTTNSCLGVCDTGYGEPVTRGADAASEIAKKVKQRKSVVHTAVCILPHSELSLESFNKCCRTCRNIYEPKFRLFPVPRVRRKNPGRNLSIRVRLEFDSILSYVWRLHWKYSKCMEELHSNCIRPPDFEG